MHIHLDPLGGIAGDMFIAAMCAMRPSLWQDVERDLRAALPGPLVPRLERGTKNGLAAQRFAIVGSSQKSAVVRYPALRERVETLVQTPATTHHAGAILERLALAEAAVHGTTPSEVHFHELADWDSLADVVAAGSIAAALSNATWSVGSLPLGSGTVRTAHGLLPVPAPATAELLRGFIVHDDGFAGERVTPTGAAILAHLVTDPAASPCAGRLSATGLGGGTRAMEGLPNVLRAMAIEPVGGTSDTVCILAFAIDDMTGEELATAAERLRQVPGVLDLSLLPRIGKKGRPEHMFELIAMPAAREGVIAQAFAETATLGVRFRHEVRATLPRSASTFAHAGGSIGTKAAFRPSGQTTKAEADDLGKIPTLAARRAIKAAAEADDGGKGNT